MPAITPIKIRRGTATEWSSANPVLSAGEAGWDSTASKLKVGDGTTAWNSLAYFLDAALAGKANSSHSHSAADLTSGTVPDARLPARLGTVAQTVTDWNLAITNGNYMGYNIPNAPTTGTWYLGDVVAHNSLYITQTVHGFTSDSNTNTATYRRSSTDVGSVRTWGAWYKLQLSQDEQDARYFITAGTTAQYYRGDKTWQALNKAAVGLSSVDNTADSAKPVSTAQQTALNLKVDNSEKGANSGVATLGVDGKVPATQLPAVAGGAIVSQIGTYAARPAANAVSIGTMYYATDVYEQYRSDGTNWVVIANGGNERGTASMTSLYSTSNGIAGPPDVPGMTVTFVAGERPVRFQVDCDLANTVDAHTTSIQVMLDGVVMGTLEASNIGIDRWFTVSKGFRAAGLTPGTSHTVKLRIFVSGGVGRIGGATANPSTLSVISL